MKNLKEFIYEQEEILKVDDVERELLPDTERYAMIFTGGTLADAEHQKFRYGSKRCSIQKDNLTEDEAKAVARRWNKYLTPGEKSYYKMKYIAVLSAKIQAV